MLDILACSIEGFSWTEGGTLVIPQVTNLIVNLIKIAVPVLLIIFGMLDLTKAVISNDEKVMKSAQSTLIKRVIYAIAVFLVISLVQLIFSALSRTNAAEGSSVSGCIECFITDYNKCN